MNEQMNELHDALITAQPHLASDPLDITLQDPRSWYRLAVTHPGMGLETAFFGDFEGDSPPNPGLGSWLQCPNGTL